MRDSEVCEHDECREPYNRPWYVKSTKTGETNCLSCFLIFDRGMDPLDVEEIIFVGGKP
jgi:hypothetical protein